MGDGEIGRRMDFAVSPRHPISPSPVSQYSAFSGTFWLYDTVRLNSKPCEFPDLLVDFFAQIHVAPVLLPFGRRDSFSLHARNSA